MKKRLPTPFFIFILALFISAPAAATPLTLDAKLLGQYRKNAKLAAEIPANAYLGGGWSTASGNFTGRTDMRFVRDLERKLDDYDLYQAVLNVRPLEGLRLDLGRQFVTEGFAASIIDGLKTTVMPPGFVDIAVYSGVPRTVERGDFNTNDGLVTGLSLGLKNVPGTLVKLGAQWRKNDIQKKELRQNDTILVGASLSYEGRGPLAPELYGVVEYNPPAKIFETGTVGLGLQPFRRLAFNIEGNYFDIDRESNRPTVLGLFAKGKTAGGRLASTLTLIPNWLSLAQGYTLQWTEIQKGRHRAGHILDVSLPFTWERIGFSLQPSYYFSRSFGGELHGGRMILTWEWRALEVELAGDFVKYTKVTTDNDTALATSLWTTYEILDGWTLAAGSEFNKNNLLDQDVRGSFKMEYHYGG